MSPVSNPKANEAANPDVDPNEGSGKFTGDLRRFNRYRDMPEDQLITEGADLLKKYVRATAHLKALAEVVVAIRMHYKDPVKKTIVDWAGRSEGYKKAIEKIYEAAGTGADTSPVRNALKYHVQNYVKQLAPEKDLIALGLKTTKRGAGGQTNQNGGQSGGSTSTTGTGNGSTTAKRTEADPDPVKTLAVVEEELKNHIRLLAYVAEQVKAGISDNEKRIALVRKADEIAKSAAILATDAEKLSMRHQGRTADKKDEKTA